MSYYIFRVIFLTFAFLTISGTIYIATLKKCRTKWMKSMFLKSKHYNDENFEDKFKETFFERFMSCFSLHENLKFLVSNNIGKNSIAAIHGIRWKLIMFYESTDFLKFMVIFLYFAFKGRSVCCGLWLAMFIIMFLDQLIIYKVFSHMHKLGFYSRFLVQLLLWTHFLLWGRIKL